MATDRMQRVILASRYVQVIDGVLTTVLTTTQIFVIWGFTPFLGSAAAASGIVILTGGVGLFAYYRPHDVHWHLPLTFDWIGLAMASYSAGWTIAYGLTGWPLAAATAAFAVVLWIAMMITLIHTMELRRKGLLKPPGDFRRDWYRMEDQAQPPK